MFIGLYWLVTVPKDPNPPLKVCTFSTLSTRVLFLFSQINLQITQQHVQVSLRQALLLVQVAFLETYLPPLSDAVTFLMSEMNTHLTNSELFIWTSPSPWAATGWTWQCTRCWAAALPSSGVCVATVMRLTARRLWSLYLLGESCCNSKRAEVAMMTLPSEVFLLCLKRFLIATDDERKTVSHRKLS